MATFIKVIQSIGLLIARLAFGAVLVFHGWTRWSSDAGLAGQVAHLQSVGIPQPQLVAWGAMLLEVVGGILLMFGVFTPALAFFFLAQQVAIIVAIKWSRGLALDNGGYEYNLVMAAASLLFLVFGSGKAGVDALFMRPSGDKPRTSPRVNDHDPA